MFDNGTDFQGFENYITVPSAPPLLSLCNTEYLLGGDTIFDDNSAFQRTSSLPTHFRLMFSIHLGLIDDCLDKYYNLFIDNALIYSFKSPILSNIPCTAVLDQTGLSGCAIFLPNNIVISIFIYLQGQLCGNGVNNEAFYEINVAMEHTALTATAFMNVTGNANVGSWGVNNLYFMILDPLYSCAGNCVECDDTGTCLSCSSTSQYEELGFCVNSCTSGHQTDSTLKACYTCHSSCVTCNGNSPNSCLTCLNTQYLSTQNSCLGCDVSCLTCNGGLNNNCLSCNPSLFLYHGTCIGSCPAGSFQNSSTTCADCSNGCSSCTSLSFCSACIQHYFLSANQCSICDASCLTCGGSLNTNCLSCNPGIYLYQGSCFASCPTGSYQFSSTTCANCPLSCSSCSSLSNCAACNSAYYLSGVQCLSCNPSCLTCNGGLANNCLSCIPGSLLYQGSCVASCPNGSYQNSSNSCSNCSPECSICASLSSCSGCTSNYYLSGTQCLSCNPSCLTCNGGLANNCLSCTAGGFLYSGTCVTSCMVGTYQSSSNTCSNCNAGCSACSSSTLCSACISGYYLSGTQCLSCNPSCLSCSGGLSNNCLSCNSPNYLYQATCVASCPSGSFQDTATTCMSCNTGCSLCSSSTICSSCLTGFYLSGSQCLSCNPSCFSCSGGLANNCFSCNNPNLLYQTTCVASCPSGSFQDTGATCMSCNTGCSLCSSSTICSSCLTGFYLSGSQCLSCNPSCLSCSGGPANNCLSCNSPNLFYQTTCFSTCPSGSFQDTSATCMTCNAGCSVCSSSTVCSSCVIGFYLSGSQCLSCNPSCLTCNGGLANNCLSCNSPNLFYQTTCFSTCPSGSFKDTSTTCMTCNTGCSTCSSSTVCSACVTSFYLTGNQCLSCNPSCLSCSGGLANNCLSCNSPNLFYQTTCFSTCPSGSFQDTSTTCMTCNTGCSVCSSSNICSACVTGFYLSGSQCLPCNPSCLTCNGGLANNCLSCNPGNLLYQGSCSISCPTGSYQNTIASCATCATGCSSCSTLTLCSACTAGYSLSAGYCISSCPSNSYYDLTKSACALCDPSCLTCSNSGANACNSCSAGLYLSSGSCFASCPQGTFPNSILNICSSCDTSCSTCLGAGTNACSTCGSGFFLSSNTCLSCNSLCLTCSGPLATDCLTCNLQYNTSCVSSCPIGAYSDLTLKKCFPCDSTCYTCNGPTSSDCTSCVPGNLNSLNQCSLSCSNGFYLGSSLNACQPCNLICAKCFGGSSNQCLSCNQGGFYQNTCVSQTPNHTYYSSTNNSFIECDVTCQKCYSSGQAGCLSCFNGNFLSNNSCLIECPSGTTKNYQTNTCDNLVEIYSLITAINNPYDFLINFFPDVYNSSIYQELSHSVLVEISGKGPYTFTSTTTNSQVNDTLFIVHINYNKNYTYNSSDSIKITVNNSNPNVNYKGTKGSNNSFQMQFLNGCLSSEYYDYIANSCKKKKIIDYNWKYSVWPNTVFIKFTDINNEISYGISNNLLEFTIPSLNSLDYNYTLSFDNKSNVLSFSLFTSMEIVGGILLEVLSNKSVRNSINLFNTSIYLNDKNCTIKLMENYRLSTLTLQMMNQTSNAGSIGEIASLASLYISLINSPGTSFALRGLILTYLIQMLGYVNINYPPNSINIFKNTRQHVFFKNDVIAVDPYDEKLPQIFAFYSISPNFLNNVIDDVSQILLVFGLGLVFKIIGVFIQRMSARKFLQSIVWHFENYFFWNIFVSVIFSKYLILTFYVSIEMTFTPSFHEFDYVIFILVFAFILIFPWHLLKILSLLTQINIQKAVTLNILTSPKGNKILPYFPELKINNSKDGGAFMAMSNPGISTKVFPEEGETGVGASPINPKKSAIKANEVLKWENLADHRTPKLNNKNQKNNNAPRKSKMMFNEVLNPLSIDTSERIFITMSKPALSPPEMLESEQKKGNFFVNSSEDKNVGENAENNNTVLNNNEGVGAIESIFYESRNRIKSLLNVNNSSGTINPGESQAFHTSNIKKWVENQPSIKIEESNKRISDSKTDLNQTENPNTLVVPPLNNNQIKGKKRSWRWIVEKTPLFSPSKIEKVQKNNKEKHSLNSYANSIWNYFKSFGTNIYHFFQNILRKPYKVTDETKYKSKFCVLWMDFRTSKGIHRYYFFFEVIRYGLIGVFSVILYNDPFTQITLLTIINFLFSIFILIKRPFNSKINYFWALFNELCINSGYFIGFIICNLDKKKNQNSDLRMNLGWILVFAYLALFYSITAQTVYIILRKIWRNLMRMKRNKVAVS